jgi:hypothetical protein
MYIYIYIHIYRHILHSTETLVGQKKLKKKLEKQWMPRAKEIFPRAILSTRAICSATLAFFFFFSVGPGG